MYAEGIGPVPPPSEWTGGRKPSDREGHRRQPRPAPEETVQSDDESQQTPSPAPDELPQGRVVKRPNPYRRPPHLDEKA